MKLIRNLIIALAVTLTAFSPLRAEEASTSPGVLAFKKEMEALEAYTKEQEPALKANPMAGIVMMRNMVTKVKAIKTDALPADLKEAFTDFSTAFAKMGDAVKDFPEKAEDMQGFMIKKSMEDPQFGVTFGQKMQAVTLEIEPKAKKLQEVGKKYGLDNIGKLGK